MQVTEQDGIIFALTLKFGHRQLWQVGRLHFCYWIVQVLVGGRGVWGAYVESIIITSMCQVSVAPSEPPVYLIMGFLHNHEWFSISHHLNRTVQVLPISLQPETGPFEKLHTRDLFHRRYFELHGWFCQQRLRSVRCPSKPWPCGIPWLWN